MLNSPVLKPVFTIVLSEFPFTVCIFLVASTSTPIGGDHSKVTEVSVIVVIFKDRGGFTPPVQREEESTFTKKV